MSWIETALNAIKTRFISIETNYLTRSDANKTFQKQATAFSGNWDDLKKKPAFSEVATSGKYSDLTGTTKILSYSEEITKTLENTSTIYKVVHGNGVYLAFDTGSGKIYRSVDALIWNLTSVPFEVAPGSILFAEDNFICFSTYKAKSYAFSPDGIEWEVRSNTWPFSFSPKIIYNGERLIGCDDQKIWYSNATLPDIKWTAAQSPIPKNDIIYGLTYGGGKCVACLGRINTGDTNNFLYSEDGISWTVGTLPTETLWNTVRYFNNKFWFLGGVINKIFCSNDLVNWETISLPDNEVWSDIAYVNGCYVVSGTYSDYIYLSYDTKNWEKINLDSSVYALSSLEKAIYVSLYKDIICISPELYQSQKNMTNQIAERLTEFFTRKDEISKIGFSGDYADLQGVPESVKNAVSYGVQTLTEDQQIQARKNLGLYYKKTLFDISWDGDTTGKEKWSDDTGSGFFKVGSVPEQIEVGLSVTITFLTEGQTFFTENEIEDFSSDFGVEADTVYGIGSTLCLIVQKEFIVKDSTVYEEMNGATLSPGVYFIKSGSNYVSRVYRVDEQKISLDNIDSFGKGTGKKAEIFNGNVGKEASGDCSHAEGQGTIASGSCSHSEGYKTEASGLYSHAEGIMTVAKGQISHVQGKCNIEDTENKYAHIVGNGKTYQDLSNAHTLDWSGNGWFAGDVYVGSTSGTNRDDGSKKLATEEYVNSQKFSGSYNDLIDKPEIPDTTPFIIDYENPKTDDYTNAIAAFNSGKNVLLKKGNEQFPMSGYDDTHCYFGGSDSAYLPGGYVNAVYAHIGQNGENYYWYPYKHAIEAAGLYSEDAGNYYTSTNVMGQLQEVGEKLANPTESIPKIESLDESNIKTFRSIEDGIYVLDGYFAPYTGSDSTFIFDPPALVSISSTDSETHVQIFEAYNNQVQHLVITDTSCEETYVPLNDIAKSAANSLPSVTASDNGKILQVVDGAWAAATIPNANGVSF